MAPLALRLVLLLLAGHSAASEDSQLDLPSTHRTPNCSQYSGMYPACPRILQAVCGSDMTTYANECVLCLEIRTTGRDIKIVEEEPC